MSEILKDRLFLGNIWDANSLQFIREKNIDAIICVAKDATFLTEIFVASTIHRYDIEDTLYYDISIHFEDITDLIHEYIRKDKTVLVHCMAGISRSATITIAYLMKFKNMTLKEAIIFVKERRPIICPNRNFVFKLADYEHKIHYLRITSFQEAIKILMSTS